MGLTFGVGLSCGNGGEGGGGTVFDSLTAEIRRTWNIYCQCFDTFGYSGHQECVSEIGNDHLTEIAQCREDLLTDFPELQENVECELAARRSVNTCLQGLSCDDFVYDYSNGGYSEAYYECLDQWSRDIDACPELSDEAAMAVLACSDWECADGTQTIYIGFVCDGEPECMDGSDESNCAGDAPPRPASRSLDPGAMYFARPS